MVFIEGFVITGVLLYATGFALIEQRPKAFLINFLACAAAAWIAEESSIVIYGFYAYNPVWKIFIADVPLVVIMAWPAIIHSATRLSSYLSPSNSRLAPLMAGCIVLTDAMLIEPISVNFNLWHWHQPGLFGVPVIGLFGWAFFAFFAAGFFIPIDLPNGWKPKLPLLLASAVLGTHLLLLISYWTVFKWIILPLNPGLCAGTVWIVSAVLSIFFWVSRIGVRIESKMFLIRLTAAIFFYILLFAEKNSHLSLIMYSLAFMPPYIVMLTRSIGSHRYSLKARLGSFNPLS